MRRTTVGVIAVVTAISVFGLVGTGTASAATALAHTPPGASSAAYSPQSEAATIKGLRDQLSTAWQAKDADAMQSTQQSLATELATLAVPQRRTTMTADTVTTVGKATAQNNQLGQALATIMANNGKSAGDLPVPGLGSLMNLIQSLLATLLALITGLLGGLPLPGGVPSLPVGTPPPGH